MPVLLLRNAGGGGMFASVWGWISFPISLGGRFERQTFIEVDFFLDFLGCFLMLVWNYIIKQYAIH